ncbi:LicD family protein [Flavonifractor hominis]|uniref:LicD family protein n=1 Tax=Flavonifractor hominis TaxID=3133178 RepID=A0ABV1EQD4_9FIRM
MGRIDEKVQLRQLQEVQLEILKKIDAFCRNHQIVYSLYAGTLLGAVRHQGFIPWDDDLDICMSRAEYNRFLEAWEKEPVPGYVLQYKEAEPAFTQSFAKIRKDHTTFLQYKWEAGRYHTGIFVDIFPVDRLPSGKIQRLLFWYRCMKYQLYTREFPPSQNGVLVRWLSRWLLAIVRPNQRANQRARLLERIMRTDSDPTLQTVMIETVATMRQAHSNTLLDEYVELPFGGEHFMCFAQWDAYLKRKYGTYLALPPEEERMWKHHPLILDFEHNLEER